MAYATPEELAAALRLQVTAKNAETLQAAVDAASFEIDHYCDRREGEPITTDEELAVANVVCIARGVEHFKAADSAFGVIGFADTGVLAARPDSFARHAATLTPLKHQFGIA